MLLVIIVTCHLLQEAFSSLPSVLTLSQVFAKSWEMILEAQESFLFFLYMMDVGSSLMWCFSAWTQEGEFGIVLVKDWPLCLAEKFKMLSKLERGKSSSQMPIRWRCMSTITGSRILWRGSGVYGKAVLEEAALGLVWVYTEASFWPSWSPSFGGLEKLVFGI